jgi:hypothetical protein
MKAAFGNAAFGALAAGLALAACSLPVVDKESDGIAQTFFDEVRAGADLTRDPHVDPSLETPAAAAGFAAIRSLLPPGAPTKVNNTGYNYSTSSGTGSNARLSHQYVYGARSITIQTMMRKPPGGTQWFVVGMEADPGGVQPPLIVGTPPAQGQGSD